MSNLEESVWQPRPEPDFHIETDPGALPYASLSQWYASDRTGNAGLIRTIQPMGGLKEWNRPNDPHEAMVRREVEALTKLQSFARTSYGRFVLPQVGINLYNPTFKRRGGYTLVTHDIQFPPTDRFVTSMNRLPRPDYPSQPADEFDYPVRFASFNGGECPAELRMQSLAEKNTMLIAQDPNFTTGDIMRGIAFHALDRSIANSCLASIRDAYKSREEDPQNYVHAHKFLELSCTLRY